MTRTIELEYQRLGFAQSRKTPKNWREIGKQLHQSLVRRCDQAIERLQAEGKYLAAKRENLIAALESSPSAEAIQRNTVIGWLFLLFGTALLFASYYFLVITFEPFRLGETKLHVLSAAFAILTAVLTELFFRAHRERNQIMFSASATGLFMLFGAVTLLAIVRANLFGVLVSGSAGASMPSVSGTGLDPMTDVSAFYSQALRILRVVLPVLTFVLDLGAGLAIHEGLDRALSADFFRYRMLRKVERKMLRLQTSVKTNEVLPDVFDTNYTAGGIQGENQLDERDRKVAMWIPVALGLAFVFAACTYQAFGQDTPEAKHDSLIIVLDLTQSTNTPGFDGLSEFKKNRDAVESFIQKLASPGMKVMVIGITSQSWSRPSILLDGKVDSDPGYFGERLASARKNLTLTFRKSTTNLQPTEKQSDVLGAVLLAAQVAESTKAHHPLIIFLSDMRQCSDTIDLERVRQVAVDKSINSTRDLGLLPRLKGASVYVLGAHSAGKSPLYWDSLRKFWEEYFQTTGARVKEFSPLRDLAP